MTKRNHYTGEENGMITRRRGRHFYSKIVIDKIQNKITSVQ